MKKSDFLENWVFVFDFAADPEMSPHEIISAVEDHVSNSVSGHVEGNVVTMGDVREAFALKMNLGHHILKTEKTCIG